MSGLGSGAFCESRYEFRSSNWGTSIDREGREQRKYSLKLGFICYIIYNVSTQGCKGEEEEKEEEKEEEQEVKEGEK